MAAAAGAAVVTGGCAHDPQLLAQGCAPALAAADFRSLGGSDDRGFFGGVSLVDADGDGDLDLMATGGYSPAVRPFAYRPSVLFLNDGAGRFERSAEPVFETADSPHSGSTWGDVDGDGDLDAFISTQHDKPDVFLRNLGGGRFQREELQEATQTPGSNFTSAWVDIDGDGDLDLVSGGPTLERAAPMLVFRNEDGRFARAAGLAIENGRSNPGALLWADFDNDGDLDMFVANSDILRRNGVEPAAAFETPQLYRNDGAWSFVRSPDQPFSDAAYSAIIAAAGDVDNDGDLDLFVGRLNGPDALFLNDGAGAFSLSRGFAGHAREAMATGAAFADFDLDGDLDLATSAYAEPIRLWRNDGSGAFRPFDQPALLERRASHWGAATGDIDGDGDIDVVIGNWGQSEQGEHMTLLWNESRRCGRPLRLELRDRSGAIDPAGARVVLVTRGARGERRQLREAMSQSTIRSQSASAFLFAVPFGERPVRAEIRWPDGRAHVIDDLRLEQTNIVQRPDRTSSADRSPKRAQTHPRRPLTVRGLAATAARSSANPQVPPAAVNRSGQAAGDS